MEVFSVPSLTIDSEYTIPEVALPTGARGVMVSLARCSSFTPDLWVQQSTVVDIALELKYDGEDWQPGGAATGIEGGIYRNRHGVEVSSNDFRSHVPRSPTRVRGMLRVQGPPLVTALSVQAI